MPSDHITPSKLIHFPRSRKGTVSTTINAVKQIIPPPPAPCMVRPTSIVVKLYDVATITDPIKNRIILALIIDLRPKVLDKEPNMG